MPGRRYMQRFRRFAPRAVINSIKNVNLGGIGVTTSTTKVLLAKAVNSPVSTVDTNVSQGCLIKAIYLTINGCGTAGSGVLNNMGVYIMKNPGDNLTPPGAFSVGTSNEKKFVFRQWFFMTMRNQDGNVPFHWEGWIRIPRIYQRMGTDDTIHLGITNDVTGHFSHEAIYKWYR